MVMTRWRTPFNANALRSQHSTSLGTHIMHLSDTFRSSLFKQVNFYPRETQPQADRQCFVSFAVRLRTGSLLINCPSSLRRGRSFIIRVKIVTGILLQVKHIYLTIHSEIFSRTQRSITILFILRSALSTSTVVVSWIY